MINQKSIGSRIFDVCNYIVLGLLVVVTLYPCYYVLIASISDPVEILASNGLLFYPKGIALYTYKEVMQSAQIWTGYRNTLIYVVSGGLLSVILTVTAAFGLTRKGLPGKNILTFMILFTMYFSGGLIPTYLVIKGVGMLDSPLAMIIPHAINTYNLIITISYFKSMPYELEEAAKIDGANDYSILLKIMIPLAKPIIAVISLYYLVALWNDFFNAMIYLDSRNLFPLQLVLREILIQNNTAAVAATGTADEALAYAENVKYATIVVSTVPILCVYPFIQKYFVKGVMIGAIKG